MKIKSNPKRNIMLLQLKDCQKGFISSFCVKAIKGSKKVNFAIDLKAQVSSTKHEYFCIPVFGTGDARLDFEIDLSSFVINDDDMINLKDLESGGEYDWHKIKVDVLDNVLSYDDSDYGDDEFFEDFYDDWLNCSQFEKVSLEKEIYDFLKRDCDSCDVSDIVLNRKNTIRSIRSLHSQNYNSKYDDEDDLDYSKYSHEFYKYDFEEKKILLELFEIKLYFINHYLLSSDNWQSLSKGTFLSIRDYMVEREIYELLFKPAKFFASKKV